MSVPLLSLVMLAGALQGFCLSVLLFTRQANQLANRLLSLLIFVISLQTILVAFDNRSFFLAYPHLSRIGWLLPAFFGPLIFLFTQKLTTPQARRNRRDWLHLLPFLILLAYLMPYFLQSADAKRTYLSNYAQVLQDDFGPVNDLLNLLHILYLLAAIRLLQHYIQRILNEYAEVEQLKLTWLRQFLRLTLLVTCIGVTAFYARKWQLSALSWVYPNHYLGVVLLIYWVGYKALALPALFNATLSTPAGLIPVQIKVAEDITEPAKADKYKKAVLPDEVAERHKARLLAHMNEQHPYRNQALTIHELASQLALSKHHLSHLLNDRLGKSFYDFINEYRVNAVKQMLADPAFRHLTTLGIAEEAGFNSKATFNAVFKKLTGMTPSEYVKNTEKVV